MRLHALNCALACVLIALAPELRATQDAVDGFVARSFTGNGGVTMPYRLFVPDARVRARPLPLIVYLHGSGGAGTDNLKQISGGNNAGTHVWIAPELQARHPAFVLAPQAAVDQQWGEPESGKVTPYAELVLQLLAALPKEFSIDRDRIYLTGQSRGGLGTWDLVTKRPEVFAAAVPLCGAGNPSRVAAARHVAIWAFHGAKDDTIPVSGSRDLVAALKAAGSPVKYTEYPEAGHNVWLLAYAERDLPDWLFAQRRKPGR